MYDLVLCNFGTHRAAFDRNGVGRCVLAEFDKDLIDWSVVLPVVVVPTWLAPTSY